MSDHSAPICGRCGSSHPLDAVEQCPAMREIAAAGVPPQGVPLRIYGGYLEARAALRANAPEAAVRVLQWLLGHLAELRGAPTERSFPSKLQHLCNQDVISPRVRAALFERALAPALSAEQAWALMSIAEHAFGRLYLKPPTAAAAH